MSHNLHPLGDRLVVLAEEAKGKTPGGILLPDTAKQKPLRGKVVAVGPGRMTDAGTIIALGVKIGDTVLYGKYSGSDVEVDGVEYKIIPESDVLAKLAK